MANVLSLAARVRIIGALVEGTSIRGTARQAIRDTPAGGKSCNKTVMALGVAIGEACAAMHDRLVQKVRVGRLEVDECWAYVGCHERRRKKGDPKDWGDAYTYFAVDPETKLVPSFKLGRRTLQTATKFMADTRSRVVGRLQMSVDGWPHWAEAVDRTFGYKHIDLGQTVKEYAKRKERKDGDRMYAPNRVKSEKRTVIFGNPKQDLISTAKAERVNMTSRMQVRRLTRLTNAFSKKRRNLAAAIALHFFHYNFCRVHESIGTTPAVCAGLTNHVWTLEEMVKAAIAEAGLPQKQAKKAA